MIADPAVVHDGSDVSEILKILLRHKREHITNVIWARRWTTGRRSLPFPPNGPLDLTAADIATLGDPAAPLPRVRFDSFAHVEQRERI
jgi:hypothetical protein